MVLGLLSSNGASRLVSALLAFAAGLISLVAGTSTPAGTIAEPWIDTSNREAVLVAWEREQDRMAPDMGWTGSYENCAAGESSRDLALATIGRVNFYRALAGVPANVTLNEEYSIQAQSAALAMSATGQLSHDPDDSFVCLDDSAREGAANSNLYLGRVGPSAIDGYIEDPGTRNRDVGHRNTILHPQTTEMGVGHIAGTTDHYPANALWVFDDGVFDDPPEVREPGGFVAWPPRGHVPAELVHPRWSFGLTGADFDAATVEMAVDGQPVELEVVTRHSLAGYVPSPIIVWEPDPDLWPRLAGSDSQVGPGETDGGVEGDLVVEVTVKGVDIDGLTRDFSYEVVIIPQQSSNELLVDFAIDVARILAIPVIGR